MLSPFPVDRSAPVTPGFLSERGYSLRHAVDADIPRLKLLYADTRAEEMAQVPWPHLVKQSFLDQQFTLQHQHYLQHFARADFLAIEHGGVVQGRYYLLREATEYLIVDICLMAGQRGQGLGRALIEHSQREAQSLGRPMHLHVLKTNLRARELYERLRFEVFVSDDTHHHMRWLG